MLSFYLWKFVFKDETTKLFALSIFSIQAFFLTFVRFYIWSRSGGSVVSVSDSWPDGCELDPRLRWTFFPAYFCLSPLQKHVRKVVGGFWKNS